MTDLVITVRGSHEARIAAEIGVARVAVRLDGADRADVISRAQALAATIQDELGEAHSSGAVSAWHSERVSIWADRPWNNEGTQLDLVHHASITMTSEWADFSQLSDWVSVISEREGVAVDEISWRLSPSTVRDTESVVAQSAVQVAVDRATAYASALGLTTVRAIEIADAGLLGTNEQSVDKRMHSARMADGLGSSQPFQLEPDQIIVSATIEARFSAR